MDVAERYLHVFESLRSRKRWTTDVTVLRLAALTLMATEVRDPWESLHAAAETLRSRSSWFGPLRSPIRYAIAAMILRRGLDPARTHDAVVETMQRMRAHGLRSSSVRALLAALLVVLHHGDGRVPDRDLDRMARILERWKRDHWFLTGTDDLPMAALHAVRQAGIEEGAVRVEGIYQALRRHGLSRGNPLQLASHILSLGRESPAALAGRFDRIRSALRERGERVGTSRYDEVAILTLTSRRPTELARRIRRDVDALRAARPRPTRELAFSLAAGFAIAREIPGGGAVGDFAAVSAAQAALDAHNAAVVAAVAAASAGAAAASS
jgi:hypothetical protein